MSDKQYYVKVSFEYGVDNEDGTFDPKTTSETVWPSMSAESAVALQNYAVIPAANSINTMSGELGMGGTGIRLEDLGVNVDKGNSNKVKVS